ncbi:hypothetical protein EYF80_005104 [Liparis tanakae]|uniref:Uncharacterized protein n=1 Tax=Liparis tanakae TaxID=230148 RepID=A0A4Z2J389_9TELE|nr:hypothetical protein EYF80_005104 [Liparis tanakae]
MEGGRLTGQEVDMKGGERRPEPLASTQRDSPTQGPGEPAQQREKENKANLQSLKKTANATKPPSLSLSPRSVIKGRSRGPLGSPQRRRHALSVTCPPWDWGLSISNGVMESYPFCEDFGGWFHLNNKGSDSVL